MAEPRAFVIGHPVKHSRSPKIHGHWLKKFGLAGRYEALDVAPDDLPAFLAGMRDRGFSGGNVTIPHKEAVFAAVSGRDEAAAAIGAINTLWFEDGRLRGGNTDAYGFSANLDQSAPEWAANGPAVVVGAGGAARAVVYALKSRGLSDIRVVNRTMARAAELARHFGAGVTGHGLDAAAELLADAGLLVNTAAAGMAGDRSLPVSPAALPSRAIVTDIVYVPLETPLLEEARALGLKTVDGLGMLLHQAVPGFEKWFGRRPEVTAELRELIVADLGSPG